MRNFLFGMVLCFSQKRLSNRKSVFALSSIWHVVGAIHVTHAGRVNVLIGTKQCPQPLLKWKYSGPVSVGPSNKLGKCALFFIAGQCAQYFTSGQCALFFIAGQCVQYFTLGKCALFFIAGQCVQYFTLGKCALFFIAGQCAQHFTSGQCALFFIEG
jgi:hypothetical protein